VDERHRNRFALVEDGVEAQLVYRLDGDRLVLEHTEVPEEIGGRGIGGKLVRAAVARAEADGLTVAPWCPYARRWIEKHPDEVRAIVVDWTPPGAGH
jgi:predicted GNAT family acetyltransferase